jgi:D-alanyl-D-alanine carboxypeptidase
LVWERALSSGKVLNVGSLQAMFTDYGHAYGFGWAISHQFGHRLQTHAGGINGFRSNIDVYPDDKLVIIILSNIENVRWRRSDASLRPFNLVFPGCITKCRLIRHCSRDTWDTINLGLILNVTRDGSRLFVKAAKQPRIEAFPESDRIFFHKAVDAQITFETDDRGRALRLVLHRGGLDTPAPRMD